MRNSTLPFIEATLASVSWGASFVATKVALREVQPTTVVWLRFFMGVIILGAAVIARKQFSLPDRKDLGYFVLLGFLGITFHQWLQSTGLRTAQATTSAWIVASSPIFIALLGWLFLRESLGWRRVAGIALAFVGVLLVVSKGNLESLLVGGAITSGDVLILISAPNWALFSVLSRYGLKHHPAARMMFYVMLFGWFMTSLLFFSGAGLSDISHLALDGWVGVAFLGVFCSGLAYIFWYDALQALPASQVGVFIYLEPLVTVLVAAVLLGEPLLLASLVGGAIILLGVWMVNRRSEDEKVVVSKFTRSPSGPGKD
jgi:drug/metabolite transporter (DMT)-like permease